MAWGTWETPGTQALSLALHPTTLLGPQYPIFKTKGPVKDAPQV